MWIYVLIAASCVRVAWDALVHHRQNALRATRTNWMERVILNVQGWSFAASALVNAQDFKTLRVDAWMLARQIHLVIRKKFVSLATSSVLEVVLFKTTARNARVKQLSKL